MFTPGTYERDMEQILTAIAETPKLVLTISVPLRRPVFYLFKGQHSTGMHDQKSYSTPAELMQGMGLRPSTKHKAQFDAESFEWLLEWLSRNGGNFRNSTVTIHSSLFLKPFRATLYKGRQIQEDFEAKSLTELANMLKMAEVHDA